LVLTGLEGSASGGSWYCSTGEIVTYRSPILEPYIKNRRISTWLKNWCSISHYYEKYSKISNADIIWICTYRQENCCLCSLWILKGNISNLSAIRFPAELQPKGDI